MLCSDEASRWALALSPGRKVGTVLLLLLLAHVRVGAADDGAPDQGLSGQVGLLDLGHWTLCDACSGALSACVADNGNEGCLAYALCVIGCTDTVCQNECAFRYSMHHTVVDINACFAIHRCLGPDQVCACDPPKRSPADVQRQVALNTLRGTYDVVYGLAKFDCLPESTMQFHFSLDPPAKPKGRPFNITIAVEYMNVTTLLEGWAGQMDPATGAIPVSTLITGFPGATTWYVIDSVKSGQYWDVMIGYCSQQASTCSNGGVVLTKRLPKRFQGPPTSVIERFKRALVQAGWSSDLPWDQGCYLPRPQA